jgi:hypothetical protein
MEPDARAAQKVEKPDARHFVVPEYRQNAATLADRW